MNEEFAGLATRDVTPFSDWLTQFGGQNMASGQNMTSVRSQAQRSEKNFLALTFVLNR